MLNMARTKKEISSVSVADMQPDEINALRTTLKEFIERMQNLDNEIALLKEDQKELVEEFKDRLDVKTLKAALQVVKIQRGVQHRDTFDLFIEALTDPAQ